MRVDGFFHVGNSILSADADKDKDEDDDNDSAENVIPPLRPRVP